MKKYKVLNKDLKSPYKGFQFVIGKEYVCSDFDESNEECSTGFYATDVEGILYSFNRKQGNKVFEVEVSGKAKIFDQFKQRFEKQTIVREVPLDQLKELVAEEDKKLDYKFEEAMFPFNPLFGERKEVTDEVKQLLDKWISVCDSVRSSVWDSVWDSVRDSVWNSARFSVFDSVGYSVCDSVWDSVWNSARYSVRSSVWDSMRYSVLDSMRYSARSSVRNSVYAYIGSLFPNIKEWKYTESVDHEEGVYPFQPAVDLWYKGFVFVPSFDGKGKVWRLHSGKDASIVFEKSI